MDRSDDIGRKDIRLLHIDENWRMNMNIQDDDMQTLTIYTYKYSHDGAAGFCIDDMRANEFFTGVVIGEQEVTIPKCEMSIGEFNNVNVGRLRKEKQRVQAETQVKLNAIEEEIQSLLAIEYKEEDSD